MYPDTAADGPVTSPSLGASPDPALREEDTLGCLDPERVICNHGFGTNLRYLHKNYYSVSRMLNQPQYLRPRGTEGTRLARGRGVIYICIPTPGGTDQGLG